MHFRVAMLLMFNVVLFGLSKLLKRNKNVWVFGSWLGEKIADNPLYIYRFLSENSNYKAVWIYKDKKLHSLTDDMCAYHYLSMKGIYYQLTCGCCIVSHSVRADLLWGAIDGRCIKVNTWHGSPIKKILADVPDDNLLKSFIRYMGDSLFCSWSPKYDIVLSSSPEVTNKLRSAFKGKYKKILEVGYPRVENLIQQAKLNEINNTIIYLPTLRSKGDIQSILFDDVGFDVEKISNYLSEIKFKLIIKPHPANKLNESFKNKIDAVENIELAREVELNKLLVNSSLMITDYSSVYLDYISLGKPVIFSKFDEDGYLSNERELYYNYSDVTWGPYLESWSDFELIVGCFIQGSLSNEQYKIAELFNSTDHEGATQKIVNFIVNVQSENR